MVWGDNRFIELYYLGRAARISTRTENEDIRD